jgi:hypothetical protein
MAFLSMLGAATALLFATVLSRHRDARRDRRSPHWLSGCSHPPQPPPPSSSQPAAAAGTLRAAALVKPARSGEKTIRRWKVIV